MAEEENEVKCEEGSPAWMTTYGDMMTLLLTFFVLIVSFSSIQTSMFHKAMGSLQGAFGITKPETSVPSYLPRPAAELRERHKLLLTVQQMEKALESGKIPTSAVVMKYDLSGIFMDINDSLLFAKKNALLTSQAEKLLLSLSDILSSKSNINIDVRGFTDDTPIHTPEFSSNWALSTARAVAVVEFLQKYGNIAPTRLSATGYGEYRPLVPNDNPENRAKNRRVQLYLKLRI
ncbi:MAG: flagellar motor protein MotB [Candidatus Cloacimonadota bacterium]|nr:flagellar motor protein MotB [Candidatus Cloacimonadota bacterium]